MAKDRSPKHNYKKSELAARQETIKATQKAITRTENYKPKKLKVKKNEYTSKLPKRPGMPKLPKLSGIKSKKVSNPSGLKGKIKDFEPKELNVSKVYKNLPKDFITSKKPGKK